MTSVFSIEADIQPDQTFTYIHLPFEVPPQTGRIDVSYEYADAISSDPLQSGGNTLDIGIIDTRGIQFMTPGFRGWSGSARRSFFIAEDAATPGYMPGPIQAGTWHICLGVYKVAPKGCHCTVAITLTPSETETIIEFPALLPVRTTTKHQPKPDHWYKGEIHCHTLHSDGDSTVDEVIAIAQTLGLDFLAITDHNNRSQQIDMAHSSTDITLIPGCEVTTYYGHWNIWGDGAWIDFRVQKVDDLQTAIAEAQKQGFLVSCNHPRLYGPDWAFPEVEGYSCVEVWNGPWPLLNEMCLAFWEARLKRGQHLVAVGGSDFHFSKEDHIAKLANPANFIYCPEEPSAANLLSHLRAGHNFISESPTGPRLTLQAGDAMMGDTLISTEPINLSIGVENGESCELQIYTAAGIIAHFSISQPHEQLNVTVAIENSLYARVQLIDPISKYVRALTNPIYFAADSRA